MDKDKLKFLIDSISVLLGELADEIKKDDEHIKKKKKSKKKKQKSSNTSVVYYPSEEIEVNE